MEQVEIRGFLQLRQLFDKKGWPYPYYLTLEKECSALELAEILDLPIDKLEAVFVNGLTESLEEARVRPGDRIGFIPYGTPGICRLLLGIKRPPDEKEKPAE
ncbi:MAG: MoaD/ThiS family protein [Bacillota bacterium]|nr:MoaD/ThiS family protein [Bacillota bacterium]